MTGQILDTEALPVLLGWRRRIGAHRHCSWLRAVADNRGYRRGHVIVDRTQPRAQEGVDERALSLLELPDHNDAHRGLGKTSCGDVEASNEVVTVLRLGDGCAMAEHVRELAHEPGLHSLSGGRNGVRSCSASSCLVSHASG